MKAANEAYTIPENCDFNHISRDRFVDNECTPKLVDENFRGVVINLPKEIIYEPGHPEPFGGFTYIPICGAYMHTVGDPPKGGLKNSLVLVAVDTVTDKVYTGKYAKRGVMKPNPAGQERIEASSGMSHSGGYFNFNLAEVVDLPEKPAEYIVYVTAGPYKSNVRSIKVIKKK